MTHNDASPSPASPVLTPAEVAELLSCSRNHVYRLISSGAFPVVDISVPGSKSTKLRVLRSDLDEYLAVNSGVPAVG